MKQFALLLAGGSGKRLWPFSRNDAPKQFITLPDGKTLLETTIQRLAPLTTLTPVILTTQQYEERIKNSTHNLTILVEPCSKNTAPALAYACTQLFKLHGDAIVAIVPTDHTISDEATFGKSLSYALEYAHHHDVVVLYGAPQAAVSARFGFISLAPQALSHHPFPLHTVAKFHEKPSLSTATLYRKDPHTVWNMGIFVGRISTILTLYARYAPDILDNLHQYTALKPRSFDHAILEHAHEQLRVLTHDFGWNDIGNLKEFIPALRVPQKTVELYGAHNNVSVAEKPIIFAGASNLTVIDLPDMILVTQHEYLESSESMAQHLVHLGRKDLV